jgi:hypothetical protein
MIENQDNRSAEFGEVSANDPKYNLSRDDSFHGKSISKSFSVNKQNRVDQDGHSDESSEGVVANHDPFNGIQEAINQQEGMRSS